MTRTVAAFDFDGTLTRHDTVLPFLASVVGWPRVAGAVASEARSLATNRDRAKERVLGRLLAGFPEAPLRVAGRAFAERVRIAPQMRARITWHRERGHDVVIVSASLDVYLHEVARELAVDDALCTRLEFDEHGRCTGRLVGGNCRGAEKVARLRAHLGDGGVVLYAYGDSRGDDEMLALADHPFRVRRGRLLPGTVREA